MKNVVAETTTFDVATFEVATFEYVDSIDGAYGKIPPSIHGNIACHNRKLCGSRLSCTVHMILLCQSQFHQEVLGQMV